MKVKELIAMLSSLDQEKEIRVEVGGEENYPEFAKNIYVPQHKELTRPVRTCDNNTDFYVIQGD